MPAPKDTLRSAAGEHSSAGVRTGRERVERIITSGGDTRPPRAIRRPLVVNVADQAGVLMSEPEWHTGTRNSITVATTDRVRVMLTALHPGAEMGGEATNDTVILQTLRGQVWIAVDGMDISLGPGQLTTIEDPSAWQLVAETEALLLITAAHPDGFVGASD